MREYVGFRSSDGEQRYNTQMAVFLRLAEWFDRLKDMGVYDNTRIIIVSDHGSGGVPPGFPQVDHRSIATLLVKDFGADGPVATDPSFMTNADTPAIALEGVVDGARNPFTGGAFNVGDKRRYVRIAHPADEATRIRHNTQWKIGREDYWTLDGDDVYDEKAWRKYYEE